MAGWVAWPGAAGQARSLAALVLLPRLLTPADFGAFAFCNSRSAC
jgi:hypothetical protein